MRYVLIIFLFLFPLAANADEGRYRTLFTSSNGKYEFRISTPKWEERDIREWSLIEKATGTVLYKISEGRWSLPLMTVLVSDDGRNITAIDDYSASEPKKDLDVLIFYREGKLVKKYTLGEILDDIDNITHSASHFRWEFSEKPLAVVNSKLKFKTYELISYTFDINSGEILKKEKDPILSGDAIYVYGEIKKLEKNRYQMKVCHLVQGSIPETGLIEFEASQKEYLYDGVYYSVADLDFFSPNSIVIKDGKMVEWLPRLKLGSCNYQRNKNLKSKSK